MMEIADTAPEVEVDPEEYRRLLGFPRGYSLAGRVQELAGAARQWYRQHGRPWLYARRANRLDIEDARFKIDGVWFASPLLAATLRQAEADSAFLVAVGAGPEAEEEAARLWLEEKPDEYFFLETFASAVVEHLMMLAGARLCAWADAQDLAVLPHSSPGYAQWDIAEQGRLLRLVEPPARLEALDSGALVPKKSQLAVFGVTARLNRVRRSAGLTPCRNCSMAHCQFRRAAYRPEPETVSYSTNVKALARWARERLSMETQADGAIAARFRYDGSTCTNFGRPLEFQYDVTLGPRQEGYPIREQRCAPAPSDTGHFAMCQYQADAPGLMAAIGREKPLLGQPLESVLAWRRESSPAGCYCDAASRDHKWGLVLETIHYALARQGEHEPQR